MYKIIGANQVQYGPVSADQLRQWIAEGRADANTQVQAEGSSEWRALRDIPEFAGNFAGLPPVGLPPLSSALAGDSGRAMALQKVSGPAIGLLVAAILGLVLSVLGLLFSLLGVSLSSLNTPMPAGLQAFQVSAGIAGVALRLVGMLFCVFILYGGMKMKKLENHGLCVGASILAMIPCLSPCCLLGLPFGIWALIVLNQSEVKEHFT